MLQVILILTPALRSTSLPFNSGWGFLYGNVLVSGTVPVTAGVWTHLAVVRDGGVTTLYVNGQPTAVTTNSAPITPAGTMEIGQDPACCSNPAFGGVIDEVRIFTFAPGAFQPSDLNYNFAIVPALGARELMLLAVSLALAGALMLGKPAS